MLPPAKGFVTAPEKRVRIHEPQAGSKEHANEGGEQTSLAAAVDGGVFVSGQPPVQLSGSLFSGSRGLSPAQGDVAPETTFAAPLEWRRKPAQAVSSLSERRPRPVAGRSLSPPAVAGLNSPKVESAPVAKAPVAQQPPMEVIPMEEIAMEATPQEPTPQAETFQAATFQEASGLSPELGAPTLIPGIAAPGLALGAAVGLAWPCGARSTRAFWVG